MVHCAALQAPCLLKRVLTNANPSCEIIYGKAFSIRH